MQALVEAFTSEDAVYELCALAEGGAEEPAAVLLRQQDVGPAFRNVAVALKVVGEQSYALAL
jgi:hypothetical protein